MKIDKKSLLIGFLSCLCLTMLLGFTQKDGNFDTIVANKILIGDRDNPMVNITKDSNGGMIFINDRMGIQGISLMTIDNHGLIGIGTHCGDLDPSCVSVVAPTEAVS